MKKVIGLLAVLALFGLAVPAFAEIEVPELLNTPADNMMMEIFNGEGTTHMVADQWHTFLVNDPIGQIVIDGEGPGSMMKFFKDIPDGTDNNHITLPARGDGPGPVSTASQGIAVGRYLRYNDGGPNSHAVGSAGIFRTVNVGPNYQNKVYMFHGYLDQWKGGTTKWGQTYRPLFGINPTGSTDLSGALGTLNVWDTGGGKYPNAGNANWMISEGATGWYSGKGGYFDSVGGFHGVVAAWPAQSSTISLWAGITVHAWGSGNPGLVGEDSPSSTFPVWSGDHFEMDSFSLHEFSFPDPLPVNTLTNGDFEGDFLFVRNSLNNDPANNKYFPDWRIPVGWVPIGGAIAQPGAPNGYLAWDVLAGAADTGYNPASTKGFGIRVRRGKAFMGIMQKVQVNIPNNFDPTVVGLRASVRVNPFWGTNTDKHWAMLGVDLNGGTDPSAPGILWSETNTRDIWQTLAIEGNYFTTRNPVITVFLMTRNINIVTGEDEGEPSYYTSATFDEASLQVILPDDPTSPLPFTISVNNTPDETGRLRFSLSIPPTDPESGISRQVVSVGTSEEGTDILDNVIAGNNQQEFDYLDLTLPNHQPIWVTVTQTNGVGLQTKEISSPFMINAIDNNYGWNTTPEPVSYNAFGSSDSPSIACAPNGVVYLAYRDSDGKSGSGPKHPVNGNVLEAPWWDIPAWAGWDSKIVFRTRHSGTWSDPKIIATNPATIGPEGDGAWDPSLAVDSTGAVHCVYQNWGTYYRNDLYDAVSTDGGASWSNNFIGPGGTNFVNWCNKAVPYGNSIIVASNRTWLNAELDPNQPGSHTSYQPAIGMNGVFEDIGGAVTDGNKGKPTPSIATLGTSIYAIWYEEADPYVYLRFAAKVGGTWGPVSTIKTGHKSIKEDVVTARSGNGDYSIAVEPGKIHVVYTTNHVKGTDTTQPGVWYVTSVDGGATWSTPKYAMGGCWPMIKVHNGRVHLIAFERSGADPNYRYQPKHMFIDNGVLSAPKAIAPAAYTSQPSQNRVSRTDYSWGDVKSSHIVPGSFDIDASGAIHFVWGANPYDRDYWWIDYYNTAGNVPQCNSIGCKTKWAMDETIWSKGTGIKKPVNFNNLYVTAEGSIMLSPWIQVPFIYVQEENRSAGIRVLCLQNANADPSDDIHVGRKVNIVNSGVTVNLVGLNDPFAEEDEWSMFGEPTIGRINSTGNIKDVTIQPVDTEIYNVTPLGMLSKSAGGIGIPGIPEIFDGMPTDPKYIVGTPATGLLVTVAGKVTYATPSFVPTPYFYLDDGSGAEGEWNPLTGSRIKGIKVYAFPEAFIEGWVNTGETWSVRGVVSTERACIYDDGNRVAGQIRVLRPCKADDPKYFNKH